MGNFSWCTSDTRKSIPCTDESYSGAPKTVYLLNPFGAPYKESDYEGYGVFGGRDVYELVAEWNRGFLSPENLHKPEREHWSMDAEGQAHYERALTKYMLKCDGIKEYAAGASDAHMRKYYGSVFGYGDGFDWKRCLGIDIACYDEDHVKLKYPIKIVETLVPYEMAGISPSCPFQGYFYGDTPSSMRQQIDEAFNALYEAGREYAEKQMPLDQVISSCEELSKNTGFEVECLSVERDER